MKKRLVLLTSLFLVSCNKNVDLNVICPIQAPSIAFYGKADSANFETNGTPSNIVSMMTSSSNKDIIVIDTVSGIRAINKGANFKIAATITFGNFFIASTGNDDNNTLDNDDKIVIFGQNQTPDLIFHYLYGNVYDNNIEYVGNVADAGKVLASGKNAITQNNIDYVFIAQPVLYNILNDSNALTYQKASVYANIQQLYKEKSNNQDLIQASIFVRNSDDKQYNKDLKNYLSNLEKSINKGIENPKLIEDGMNKISKDEQKAKFGIVSEVASKIMANNELGLGYKDAYSIKSSIDSFVELFGIEKTNEEIYYK